MTKIEYSALPSIPVLLAKLAFSRTKDKGKRLPDIKATFENVVFDESHYQQFLTFFNYPVDLDYVPNCYALMMTNKPTMWLFGSAEFSLQAMGIIHLSSFIQAYKPIPKVNNLTLSLHINNQQARKKGGSFDVVFELQHEGDLITTITNSYLSKQANFEGDIIPLSKEEEKTSDDKHVIRHHLKGNAGREYAKLSGDYNPIHLRRWSAKLFGFKNAIIHGMSNIMLIDSSLKHVDQTPIKAASFTFTAPVFLPSDVVIEFIRHNGATKSYLKTHDQTHIMASISQ